VIVTVEGPSTPLTVRRKDRVAGIWINNASVAVDSAPSFYAVATTGPLDEILRRPRTCATHHHRPGDPRRRHHRRGRQSEDFCEADVRVRTADGRYRLLEGPVELTEDTLFRTDVTLPANLTEGEYKVRLFLCATAGGRRRNGPSRSARRGWSG
jgi:uncharacterized protein (TIGR02186 family)